MKKPLLTALMVLAAIRMFAQDAGNIAYFAKSYYGGYSDNSSTCAPAYLGFSGGINNPAGTVGIDADVPFTEHASTATGVGFSTWGVKMHLDAKYYFHPCNLGFALGGGFTYNFGVSRYSFIDEEDVPSYATLYPQANIFAGAYYYFKLGAGLSRYYAGLGWSQPLLSKRYLANVSYGYPPYTSNVEQLDIHAPGGPMISAGALFALGKRGRR